MLDPNEKTDEEEYEVVAVYEGKDTVIEYDMDDNQHVYVKDE